MISSTQKRDFGSDPIATRFSGNYVFEYIEPVVDKWDDLINWKKRAEGEGNFFEKILKQHNAKSVLDVATGTGFHSVTLLKAGFSVTSTDGSQHMLHKADKNAKLSGFKLRTIHSDWRSLSQGIDRKYDAIICLGNSFTHLFTEKDRKQALSEFYAILNHEGILIIDHRNYDAMLDNGFSTKHKYYYCGDNIKAEPEYVDEELARFVYTFPDSSKFYLNMFPLRKKYVCQLLLECGFKTIDTYCDFEENFPKDCRPDYFIHVVRK